MQLTTFKEKDLPYKELETIGLAAGEKLLLNIDDLKNLLSGRRTGLMQLQNLEAENIKIKSMDAKLSLFHNPAGGTELRIHPIYRKPQRPDYIDEQEADQLIKGSTGYLQKITKDDKGNTKELLVEYDAETREFIISDTDKILAPDMVNGEFLTPAQKEDYRKGKEVELPDKTVFQYAAAEPQGIRSNKLAIIASIVVDGGMSYLMYEGLNALFNKKRDLKMAEQLSPGYHNAVKDAEAQRNTLVPEQVTRGYTRGGATR
ncbi:hypothetical protein GCM10023149_50450 [Mucilaginibacter gynuensis]|uniref:DUF4099 domain-containing protein n=1 Tax=Mucilaginibacter gynuensis TaxID=1302236 RepID=A0ABP8HJ39_9SPHI